MAAAVGLVAFAAVIFIREVPLRTTVSMETPDTVVAERQVAGV